MNVDPRPSLHNPYGVEPRTRSGAARRAVTTGALLVGTAAGGVLVGAGAASAQEAPAPVVEEQTDTVDRTAEEEDGAGGQQPVQEELAEEESVEEELVEEELVEEEPVEEEPAQEEPALQEWAEAGLVPGRPAPTTVVETPSISEPVVGELPPTVLASDMVEPEAGEAMTTLLGSADALPEGAQPTAADGPGRTGSAEGPVPGPPGGSGATLAGASAEEIDQQLVSAALAGTAPATVSFQQVPELAAARSGDVPVGDLLQGPPAGQGPARDTADDVAGLVNAVAGGVVRGARDNEDGTIGAEIAKAVAKYGLGIGTQELIQELTPALGPDAAQIVGTSGLQALGQLVDNGRIDPTQLRTDVARTAVAALTDNISGFSAYGGTQFVSSLAGGLAGDGRLTGEELEGAAMGAGFKAADTALRGLDPTGGLSKMGLPLVKGFITDEMSPQDVTDYFSGAAVLAASSALGPWGVVAGVPVQLLLGPTLQDAAVHHALTSAEARVEHQARQHNWEQATRDEINWETLRTENYGRMLLTGQTGTDFGRGNESESPILEADLNRVVPRAVGEAQAQVTAEAEAALLADPTYPERLDRATRLASVLGVAPDLSATPNVLETTSGRYRVAAQNVRNIEANHAAAQEVARSVRDDGGVTVPASEMAKLSPTPSLAWEQLATAQKAYEDYTTALTAYQASQNPPACGRTCPPASPAVAWETVSAAADTLYRSAAVVDREGHPLRAQWRLNFAGEPAVSDEAPDASLQEHTREMGRRLGEGHLGDRIGPAEQAQIDALAAQTAAQGTAAVAAELRTQVLEPCAAGGGMDTDNLDGCRPEFQDYYTYLGPTYRDPALDALKRQYNSLNRQYEDYFGTTEAPMSEISRFPVPGLTPTGSPAAPAPPAPAAEPARASGLGGVAAALLRR